MTDRDIADKARAIAHQQITACRERNGDTGVHGKACDRLTREIAQAMSEAYDAGFEASGKLTAGGRP